MCNLYRLGNDAHSHIHGRLSRRGRGAGVEWASGPSTHNVTYPTRDSRQIDATFKYLWDGWNLAMEIDGEEQPIRSYAWGLDLSGSQQGAGGVGGLCFETAYEPSANYPFAEVPPRIKSVSHATFDYNGNLTSLRNTTGNNGGTDARYEYGPFGESLTSRDTLAGTNPFRFSTKYTDPETGLLYYGYRYYNAGLGRWMNRDPIGTLSSSNEFSMASNSPILLLDILGLWYIAEGDYWKSSRAIAYSDCGDSLWGLAEKVTGKGSDSKYLMLPRSEQQYANKMRADVPVDEARFSTFWNEDCGETWRWQLQMAD